MRFTLCIAVALSLAAAPASGQQSSTDSARTSRPISEFRGLYETGFEVSWFHPCDGKFGDNVWWVTLTDDALRQRDSIAAKLPPGQGQVYVRWRGTVSDKMPAGHGGRGSRYMLVTEVLEMRRSSGTSCATT